jgi:hypothetical protein
MNPVAMGSDGLRTVQLAVAPYPEREGKRWATREDLLPEVLDGGNPLASFCRETRKLLLYNGLTTFLRGGVAGQSGKKLSRTALRLQ